jgi:hypothetical protein
MKFTVPGNPTLANEKKRKKKDKLEKIDKPE